MLLAGNGYLKRDFSKGLDYKRHIAEKFESYT